MCRPERAGADFKYLLSGSAKSNMVLRARLGYFQQQITISTDSALSGNRFEFLFADTELPLILQVCAILHVACIFPRINPVMKICQETDHEIQVLYECVSAFLLVYF